MLSTKIGNKLKEKKELDFANLSDVELVAIVSKIAHPFKMLTEVERVAKGGITRDNTNQQLNIEDEGKINNKDSLLNLLNRNLRNYDNYIKKNIKPDTDELGYNKIIRILKEKYSIS